MTEPTRSQRLLDIVAYLLGHRRPVPVHQLLSNLPGYRTGWSSDSDRDRQTARRKFERDKAELAAMGIPLETVELGLPGTEDATGYRLDPRNLYLPDLRIGSEASAPTHPDALVLSADEADAVLAALRQILELPSVPLHHEARMALRKLTFDLDPTTRPALPVRIVDRPGGADPQGLLPDLMDAVHRRKHIGVDYHSIGRDARARRDLEPWGLLFQWGCWYLAAREVEGTPDPAPDRDPEATSAAPSSSGEVRLFRVDRMSSLAVNGQRPSTPDFRVPDDFDLGDRADRRPWELGPATGSGEVALVRFHGPAALLARRNGWGAPLPHAPGEENGVGAGAGAPSRTGDEIPELRSFRVLRTGPFLRWILARGGDAEVVSPPGLRGELAEMASTVAGEVAATATPPGAGGAP